MYEEGPEGWSDTEFRRVFEFHRSTDGDFISFEANFIDGQLVEIAGNDIDIE